MNENAEQVADEIYAACDEEFGAEHHYEAVRRANELVGNFEVDRPRTPVQGAQLMRKAYAEVAARHQPKDPPPARPVPSPGLRGLSVTDLEDSKEFKSGTLDEVAADMGRKMKAGTWKRGFTQSADL